MNAREVVAGTPRTGTGGLTVYHPDTAILAPGVAENFVKLVRVYAQRASVQPLPPVTLSGPGSSLTWEQMTAIHGVSGDAGASYEEERRGNSYRCLVVFVPAASREEERRSGWLQFHRSDIEGVIAHEMTHLRWWNLRHGVEFDARVRALLAGVQFPPHSGWSRTTRDAVAAERARQAGLLQRALAELKAGRKET